MARYIIKFFGSKDRHEQVKQVKTFIDAPDKSAVKDLLIHRYGYVVVNGLKIRDDDGE